MGNERERERDLFRARIEDAVRKCERGAVACTPFLTPYERRVAERLLQSMGMAEQAWFWGGYAEAERTCLFLLPAYLCALLEDAPSRTDARTVCALLEDDADGTVSSVLIRGSGFRALSHRDYLGSVLGLGLERDAIGDIALQDEHRAVVFCSRRVAGFLCELLEKVASDTARVSVYQPDEHFTDGRRYRPISDTVASARLDCVIAALTGGSREQAQQLIRGGSVEVDFEPEERVSLELTPPTTVSVRGYGRYILRAFDGETRKGRLRLRADQLI